MLSIRLWSYECSQMFGEVERKVSLGRGTLDLA